MPAIRDSQRAPGSDPPKAGPEPPAAQQTPVANKIPDASQFPRPPRAPYTPHCTHVTMTRAYGATCQNCNRKSPLGWVWQCTYDEANDPWDAVKGRQSAVDACDPSDRIAVMKALKFHQSVIDQAENGLYTPEQIDRLIGQKQKALDTINGQSPDKAAEGNVEQPEATDMRTLIANLVRQEIRAQLSSASATTVAKERAKHARTVHPRCRFKCCQSCRADFRSRSFESFDAVLNGEVKPLRPAEISTLPVRDARVMRDIGMKSLPPLIESSIPTDSENSEPDDSEPAESDLADSIRTWRTTDSAHEHRSRESAQARAFYRVEPVNDMGMYESMHFNDFSFRRSVRNSVSLAVKHVFGKRRESSSDGSAVTLPVARSAMSSKDPQDSGLSLPRSFFSPRNPSILAVAPSTIMREGIPTPAPTCSSSSNSSVADDEGGVNLNKDSVQISKPGSLPQALITQA
ncbi:flagellar motor protein [Diplodia corticola]|uniref:Flagellar motor protein n=1 Tax=Diplodia corticola TaxID=236234 RepID=A0A1J9QRP4_9PEZI|nr:flagellar motor protein [Diplodia corticola]OJD30682.1 flagellar motor protein [Diplodia corticola]